MQSVPLRGDEFPKMARLLACCRQPTAWPQRVRCTRICVAGRGRGYYVAFERRRIGANRHTIAFDSGETVVVNLKKEE